MGPPVQLGHAAAARLRGAGACRAVRPLMCPGAAAGAAAGAVALAGAGAGAAGVGAGSSAGHWCWALALALVLAYYSAHPLGRLTLPLISLATTLLTRVVGLRYRWSNWLLYCGDQGPDHSSARPERLLQLCNGDPENMPGMSPVHLADIHAGFSAVDDAGDGACGVSVCGGASSGSAA